MNTELFQKFKEKDISETWTESIISALIHLPLGDQANYYKPLIRSSVLNFKVYPETLDWLAYKYYKRQTIPSIEKVGIAAGIKKTGAIGELVNSITSITTDAAVNMDNVKKFEDNLTVADRIKIQFANFLTKRSKKFFKEDNNARLFLHAALINYYIHPETLDYIMNNDNYLVRPSIVRHYLYQHKLSIIFIFVLLCLAFYGVKTHLKKQKFGTIKKKKRSNKRSRIQRKKSKRSKRQKRKSKKLN